ncbi:hypothetical protein ACFVIM_35005, partial [Streptomyces sp. NPDC057638]
ASAAQANFSASYARDSAADAHDAADDAEKSALNAGKSAEQAKTEASGAWKHVAEKAQAEYEAAKKAAEEKHRKAMEAERKEREQKECAPGPGLTWCLLAFEDADVDWSVNDTKLKMFKDFFAVADFTACIEDPTVAQCAAFGAALTPFGKVKKVDDYLDKVDELADATRLGKIGKTRDAVLKDGKPRGVEDSKGVQMISPEEIQEVREDLRKKLGEPDQVKEIPGKGTIEIWKLENGNINYRGFSSSGGKADPTIDFTGDLQKELGFKRYHAKH